LKLAGLEPNQRNMALADRLVRKESGWRADSQNNWDSNAKKGTPSKGIAQCIDPTFKRYHIPGHNDIWNPVDNLAAGLNYAKHRYGSKHGLARAARPGGY
jgi:SLT domain-containing protein